MKKCNGFLEDKDPKKFYETLGKMVMILKGLFWIIYQRSCDQ